MRVAFLCVWLLVAAHTLDSLLSGDSERILSSGLIAIVLSLPASLVVPSMVAPVLCFGWGLCSDGTSVLEVVLHQLACFVVGYLQFLLVVRLLANPKKRPA